MASRASTTIGFHDMHETEQPANVPSSEPKYDFCWVGCQIVQTIVLLLFHKPSRHETMGIGEVTLISHHLPVSKRG